MLTYGCSGMSDTVVRIAALVNTGLQIPSGGCIVRIVMPSFDKDRKFIYAERFTLGIGLSENVGHKRLD